MLVITASTNIAAGTKILVQSPLNGAPIALANNGVGLLGLGYNADPSALIDSTSQGVLGIATGGTFTTPLNMANIDRGL